LSRAVTCSIEYRFAEGQLDRLHRRAMNYDKAGPVKYCLRRRVGPVAPT
jgi:hypothetical protein